MGRMYVLFLSCTTVEGPFQVKEDRTSIVNHLPLYKHTAIFELVVKFLR